MKRSEAYFVTVHDAAIRGLVRVGGIVGAATLGVARTAVVGVTGIAARAATTVGAAIAT